MASAVANTGFQLQPNYVNPSLARDTQFKDMFPTTAPKDLLYNDILMAPAGTRQWMETLADNGTQFSPVNQKFTVTLRSRSVLDFSQAFLDFQASCTSSDSTNVFFTNGIWNLFSRIRVLVGSYVIMDQLEKNVFESFNYAFCRASNYDSTVGYSIQGIGSVAQRQSWAQAGKTYIVPLNIPVLTSEEMIMANNQGFTIEFYLAPASAVVCNAAGTSGTATLNYTITNPRIRCHEVRYQDDLQRALVSLSPVVYPYVNYKQFSTQILAGSTTFQYTIPVKVQGLIRLLAFMRPSADVNNPAVTDCLTTDFAYNNCLQYQLRVDNDYYPPQPLSAGGTAGPEQAYLECLACMDKAELARLDVHRDQNNGTHVWKNWDRFIPNIDDFTSNRFAVCLDLKSTTDNDPNYVQRFDVTPGNVQLILNVNFASGNPTTNQTLYVYMVHTSMVVSDNAGNFTLLE